MSTFKRKMSSTTSSKIQKFIESFPINTVYKKCCSKNRSFLVAMTKGVLHNEERPGIVCKNFAKFRTNVVWTLGIIDIATGEEHQSVYHVNPAHDYSANYICGESTYPTSFNYDVTLVCAEGIHYFTNADAALIYDIESGCVPGYYPNGKKCIYPEN